MLEYALSQHTKKMPKERKFSVFKAKDKPNGITICVSYNPFWDEIDVNFGAVSDKPLNKAKLLKVFYELKKQALALHKLTGKDAELRTPITDDLYLGVKK